MKAPKKYKISKKQNKKSAPLTSREKVMTGIMVVVMVACVASNTYFIHKNSVDKTNDLVVKHLATDGEMTEMKSHGVSAWLPVDGVAGPVEMKQEEWDQRYPNTVQCAARSEGGYPWEIVGYTTSKEQYINVDIDILNDTSSFIDAIRPLVIEGIESAWMGTKGSMNVDIIVFQMDDGRYAVEGNGTCSAVVVYQDPDDSSVVTPTAVEAPFYYQATLVDGKPFVAWALIDYSTGRGIDWCQQAVSEALSTATSITIENESESEVTEYEEFYIPEDGSIIFDENSIVAEDDIILPETVEDNPK